MWQLLASQLTLNIRLHCSCRRLVLRRVSYPDGGHQLFGGRLGADTGGYCAVRCKDSTPKTKMCLCTYLMYVACSLCHSFYMQLFTQSWADKRCMHSVSPPSATRFASISVDMCARISCKRVHCSAPHDSSLDAFHSSLWLSRHLVSPALIFS